jgi:hypothetical protein
MMRLASLADSPALDLLQGLHFRRKDWMLLKVHCTHNRNRPASMHRKNICILQQISGPDRPISPQLKYGPSDRQPRTHPTSRHEQWPEDRDSEKVNPMNKLKGPDRAKAEPIPTNMPVPIDEPIFMSCMWRELRPRTVFPNFCSASLEI